MDIWGENVEKIADAITEWMIEKYFSQIIVQVLISVACIQGMGKMALLQFTTNN